jgi:hypothetical protein
MYNFATSVVSQGISPDELVEVTTALEFKSKLQRIHYRLYLKYLGYDLYRRITATSTFMLRPPIATILYSISTSYHNMHTPFSTIPSFEEEEDKENHPSAKRASSMASRALIESNG